MKGIHWKEIDFLWKEYERIFEDALLDEDLKKIDFEKSFTKRIKKVIHEWTSEEDERRILLRDMMDCALDERMGL